MTYIGVICLKDLNEIKELLNNWYPKEVLVEVKKLSLDFFNTYEELKKEVNLENFDNELVKVFENYYNEIRKYEDEWWIEPRKEIEKIIYKGSKPAKLIHHLFDIREDLYTITKSRYLDDELLELLSELCSNIGEECYNKFFPE